MPHPVTLVHANADEFTRVLQGMPLSGRVSSCLIGYWFWEIAHFPLAFADRFRYLDEVWAPSRFCQRAFETLATVPVRYVPPCVTAPQERRPDRRRFGMEPDRFYFFFAFDVLSVSGRKNPWGVIEVVRRLRRCAERPVGLVLKVANGRLAPDVLGRIVEMAGNLSMVLLLDPMRREEMEALLASCDACLSLHRSEGLGLLPIECMYLGKPVIATGYGGVTDFLDEETGFPVRYTLRPLERAEGPYPQGAAWAEPDVSQAVELAERVVADPAEAAGRAETARRRVSELFGVAAASRRFAAEVARVALAYDPARSRERVRGGSRPQEPTDPAQVTESGRSRPGYPG
jgi:glycosyltransferase involved in cell wall biosynthesis